MQNTYTKEKEAENAANAAKDRITDYAQSAIREGQEKVKDVAGDMNKRIKQGQEQLGQFVSTVDKQLHDNPWPVVAGVAVSCLILGFIAGNTKSK